MKQVILTLFLILCFLPGAFAEEKPTDIPVLMVHGYFLPGGATWLVLKNRLIAAGWPKDYVMNPSFDNVVGCNPEHAQKIAQWVNELKAKTGADKVNLVAHSMGALDVRYYIKYLCGYKNVNKVVNIAGANHGTTVACVDMLSCGASEMCRKSDDWKGNDFLRNINACDETPGDILYTSIWSPSDEIIRPPESSILDGAENIKIHTKLVGHGRILTISETGDLVIKALKEGGANDNGPGLNCLQCSDVSENEPKNSENIVGDSVESVSDASVNDIEFAENDLPDASETVDETDLVKGEFQADIMPETPKIAEVQGCEKDTYTGEWLKAVKTDDGLPVKPAGGCDQGSGPGTGGLVLVLLLLGLLKKRGLAVLLIVISLHGMARPMNRKVMLRDINPIIRPIAATRMKDAPIYRMRLSTIPGQPYKYSANLEVSFNRPPGQDKALFYLYGDHPDLHKQGGKIQTRTVQACGGKALSTVNGPNMWVSLKNCGSRKKIDITMGFDGQLAKLQKDRATLAGELIREAGDMLSGSPSFELAFGAFAYGRGFYNYFGFYPLLASFQAGKGGWIKMKSNILGDAPEPDAAFYDVRLVLPKNMTAAVPGRSVSSSTQKKNKVFHIRAAGFRHFSFAFGNFDRLQSSVDGIRVEVYVKKGLAKEAVSLLSTAGKAIRFFQKHIYPYPNRRFLVVETPLSMGVAGLEASGLVYISSMMVERPKGLLGQVFAPGLRQILPFVVAHETAHEWWAHLIGNSTWKAPFMDEALANEYSLYFLEQQKGPEYCTNLCGNILATYAMVRSIGSKDAPVSSPASTFGNDIYGYLGVVYAKGGYMMELIRHSLGNRAFDARMHRYAGRFAFIKASARDLETMLAPSGIVANIYKRFVYGTTGDREICPPGLLYLSMCMNNCISDCMDSKKNFWKSRE